MREAGPTSMRDPADRPAAGAAPSASAPSASAPSASAPPPGASPERRWRWATWFTVAMAVFGISAKLVDAGVIRLPTAGIPRDVGQAIGLATAIVVWALVFTWLGRLLLRQRDPGRGSDAGALGRPHDVELEVGRHGIRLDVRVTLTADALRIEVTDARARLGALDPPLPESLALAEIDAVRTEAASVVLVATPGDALHELRFAPRTYAARERLLWELAVRRPEAFRHLPERTAAPAPSRTLPPTGAAGGDDAPAGDARSHFAELDAHAEPLGSGLVSADRAQRAPPRSKLGCGLFAAEPRDDDAATSPPATGR